MKTPVEQVVEFFVGLAGAAGILLFVLGAATYSRFWMGVAVVILAGCWLISIHLELKWWLRARKQKTSP